MQKAEKEKNSRKLDEVIYRDIQDSLLIVRYNDMGGEEIRSPTNANNLGDGWTYWSWQAGGFWTFLTDEPAIAKLKEKLTDCTRDQGREKIDLNPPARNGEHGTEHTLNVWNHDDCDTSKSVGWRPYDGSSAHAVAQQGPWKPECLSRVDISKLNCHYRYCDVTVNESMNLYIRQFMTAAQYAHK
jgi:hypothetical protein